jgi:ligand-binding SRPBCC domain-containing protein
LRTFRHSFVVKSHIQRVWDFYRDVEHLETITPKEIDLKIINATNQMIVRGQEIWVSGKIIAKIRRRMTWHSKIAFLKAHEYVDEMLAAPFKKWRHLHKFRNLDGKQVATNNHLQRCCRFLLDQKLQLRAESELKSELASNPLKTELVTQVIWIAFFRDIKIKIQKHILWSYYCACMMYDQFEMGKIVLEQNALLPLATAIKGETVPFNDLKKSVIIAIQTMKQALKRSENTHDFESEAAATALQAAETALRQLV